MNGQVNLCVALLQVLDFSENLTIFNTKLLQFFRGTLSFKFVKFL